MPTGTQHEVKLVRWSTHYGPATVVELASESGLQNIVDDSPTPASLATRMVLELERELAELRQRMIVANLWDAEVRL